MLIQGVLALDFLPENSHEDDDCLDDTEALRR